MRVLFARGRAVGACLVCARAVRTCVRTGGARGRCGLVCARAVRTCVRTGALFTTLSFHAGRDFATLMFSCRSRFRDLDVFMQVAISRPYVFIKGATSRPYVFIKVATSQPFVFIKVATSLPCVLHQGRDFATWRFESCVALMRPLSGNAACPCLLQYADRWAKPSVY